jgi:predicted nuclease of predicted toxin-antitoxin system
VRFLIDECLSPALAREAQRSGSEAYHLAHLGRAGLPDREIIALALARDMVLVTNNASDFRSLYATQKLHPGLVIFVPNADRETQLRLTWGDAGPGQQAVEVNFDGDTITFDKYELSRGDEAR